MKFKKSIQSIAVLTAVLTLNLISGNNAKAQLRGDLREGNSSTQRNADLVLNMGGQIFGQRGGRIDGTLFLKEEIKRRYPHLELDELQLESLTVIGNSESLRSSSSTLTLYIANRYQDSARLGLSGHNRRHADVADLSVRDSHLSRGRVHWQIDFDAATRINQIIVRYKTERRPLPPAPTRMRSLGVVKAMKAVIVPVTLTVRDWVDTIQIRGVDNTVSIEHAEATLTNGERVLLNLRGHVRPGQVLRENLRRELPIASILIHATSVDLIGSRGEYEILVGNSRRH